MAPYNALQIVLFIPLLLRFRNDPSNRIVPLDFFMAFYVFWIAVVIYHHHGTSRAVYIVNQTVTIFGGYLIGRVMIRNAADYRRFFTWFFWGSLIFLPFAVFELLTRQMLVSEILGKITPVHPRAGQPPRLGLFRVQGFTEHSILFGLYCSLGVANFFYIYRDELAKRLTRTGHGGLHDLHLALLGAEHRARDADHADRLGPHAEDLRLPLVRARSSPSAWCVAFIQLGFENGLVGLVIDNLAFDPKTGWGRTEIFQYGASRSCAIRSSASASTTGCGPGGVSPRSTTSGCSQPCASACRRSWRSASASRCTASGSCGSGSSPRMAASYRRGYLVAWVGLIFVLATVAIWGAVAVMVMAYIGAGAWFYTGDAGEAPEAPPPPPGRCPPHRPRRAAAAAGRRRRSGPRDRGGPAARAPRPTPPQQDSTRMMIETFRKLRDLLVPRERRGLYLLLGILMVGGLFETFGIASVLPFMAVLSQPERIQTTPQLAAIYDALGFASPQHFLIFLGVGSFLFVLMGVLTHILSLYAIARFSNMRSYTLSSRLLRGYLHQPYSWFLNRHSADLGKTILNEVDSVVNHTMIPTLKMISNTFICLFIVMLLVYLQPWVALGTAAVLGSCYAAILLVARKYLTHFGQMRFLATRERYRIAQEATGGIKDVKFLGLENVYLRRYQIPTLQNARANTFRSVVGESPRYLLQGLAFGGMLLMILILLFTGGGSLAGVLPLLAIYAFAGLRLLPAMQQIYAELTMIRFNRMALDSLHKDMTEIQRLPGRACRPRRCGWSRCTCATGSS